MLRIGEEPVSCGASESQVVNCDQVGCSYYKHQLRRQILKDVVDRVEVYKVFLLNLLALGKSEVGANRLTAILCPLQENNWQVFQMPFDVKILGIMLDLFSVPHH